MLPKRLEGLLTGLSLVRNPLDERRMQLVKKLSEADVPPSDLPMSHRKGHRAGLEAKKSTNSMLRRRLMQNRLHLGVSDLGGGGTPRAKIDSSGRHNSRK